ncbi:MAG: hypothetical protein GWN58_22860 [Anaerolineae bacterium]|nr:hypothetical protein [Thermoplasmata archaeon]NIV32216.1 hypothetical protein [Anaerolineae bacterium]NIY03668.1 hypothetical protein [Thermoplasmata archaeon]
MSYTLRYMVKHGGALGRWGQVYGWCRAMLWVYAATKWSRISRKELERLIKKLEKARPTGRSTTVKVNQTQREFLRWSCEYLGIKYTEA